MWFTPSSTARRSTPIARLRSLGVPSPNATPFCVRRIAPKPIRLTVRSPSVQVPEATAVIVFEIMSGVCHAPDRRGNRTHPAQRSDSGATPPNV